MSTAVQTVRGPVQPTDLGPTLMHEHVFVMAPEALVNYGAVWGPAYWDEEERVADAIAKLTRLREGGITTLVDPTVPGLGRDIARIQRINAESTCTSSSPPACTPSWRCRASWPREPMRRSPICSCASSSRGSTTPACGRRFSSAPSRATA